MTEQEFKSRADAMMRTAYLMKYEFITLLNDYYKDSPDERGKTDTAFFHTMAYCLDTCECGLSGLRLRLDRPEFKFPDDQFYE
jgi:hypothetical protein